MPYSANGRESGRWHERHGRTLRRVIIANALFIIVGNLAVGADARWNWLYKSHCDGKGGQDLLLPAVDWTSLPVQMHARGWMGPGTPVIGALRWVDAGKLDYALEGAATVICLGNDPREFGQTHPARGYLGQAIRVFVPGSRSSDSEAKILRMFQEVDYEGTLLVLHDGQVALTIQAYLGVGFGQPATGPSRADLDATNSQPHTH